MKLYLVFMCLLVVYVAGQRITTIQLDGVQYFVSRMNPYSPVLNYYLAYQFCRSLGLQLVSFDSKEKFETMTEYLHNAGYSKYSFWTSGNRLGTGMFLWMSSGTPFNATFNYFENSKDAILSNYLDPIDKNSNTSPQRTARDSSVIKSCLELRATDFAWAPQDCSQEKDFICEQTRCYYFNYGSIQVTSAQGRPVFDTTTTELPITTTEYTDTTNLLLSDTNKPPSASSLSSSSSSSSSSSTSPSSQSISQSIASAYAPLRIITDNAKSDSSEELDDEIGEDPDSDSNVNDNEEIQPKDVLDSIVEVTTTVEQRLRKISEEITKFSNSDNDGDIIGRKSFLTLSDLIKTLGPSNKKTPQIDSDYSNTLRVLGETSASFGTNGDERSLNDGDP